MGSWTPHILLAAELPEGDHTDALLDLITAQPRVAGAVVTASENADLTPEEGWTLHCAGPDETIVLPGSGLPIKLQGLTDQHFADAIELLTLAAADTDVPARDEWLDGLLDTDDQTEAEKSRAAQDHEDAGKEDPADDAEEISDDETPQPQPVPTRTVCRRSTPTSSGRSWRTSIRPRLAATPTRRTRGPRCPRPTRPWFPMARPSTAPAASPSLTSSPHLPFPLRQLLRLNRHQQPPPC